MLESLPASFLLKCSSTLLSKAEAVPPVKTILCVNSRDEVINRDIKVFFLNRVLARAQTLIIRHSTLQAINKKKKRNISHTFSTNSKLLIFLTESFKLDLFLKKNKNFKKNPESAVKDSSLFLLLKRKWICNLAVKPSPFQLSSDKQLYNQSILLHTSKLLATQNRQFMEVPDILRLYKWDTPVYIH